MGDRTQTPFDQAPRDAEAIAKRAEELGPWFHNLKLRGVQTAPGHFLGDYPAFKWATFARVVPADLTGKTVLDVGCCAGFYALEMKRRGADRVVGIDSDDGFLAQARFAADVEGLDIEYRNLSVYDVGALGEKFDLVIFMGVLYHLRHPLLALDLLHEHVVGDKLLFQTLQRGSSEVDDVAENYDFSETEHFDRPGYPKLHFIEHRYSHDETNWWTPNPAASLALLRASGFAILDRPAEDVYWCERRELPSLPDGPRAVYPAKGKIP